jgi:putative transposase
MCGASTTALLSLKTLQSMSSPRHKQCKRYDISGDAHCLTFSCFHRLPLFSRDRSRGWMLDALELGRHEKLFDMWAFVVMPEHVHVVVRPGEDVGISRILKSLKQSVSRRALEWLQAHEPKFVARLEVVQPNGRRIFRFWQRGGGYDRNLRSVSERS